jgi:uncharacterized membrane protein
MWLAWASLAGAISWVLLWFAGGFVEGNAPAIGIFLLGLAVLYYFAHAQPLRLSPAPSFLRLLHSPNSPRGLAWAAAGSAAVLVLGLVESNSYGFWSVATLTILAALYLAAGRWNQSFDGLSIIAAVATALLVGIWRDPALVALRSQLFTIGDQGYVVERGPVVARELVPFVSTTVGLAVLFGLGGFLALWGARRPALWAGISATVPVGLLAITYARITGFDVDLRLAATALFIAATGSIAAAAVGRHRDRPGLNGALGVYAAAVAAAVSLGVAMALQQVWLTVALSIELPVLAWISRELNLKPLRIVAAVLAIAVLARLVLNPDIFEYQLGEIPGLNWLLYGYGVPAVSFFAAARWFRRVRDDHLVSLLEAGAIAFVVLLVSMELRSIIEGSIDSARYGLLEQSAQSIAWLAIAYGMAIGYQRDKRIVSLWACRILVGAATAQVVFLQALVSNPLWSGDQVGNLFILNVLSLAYVVPAIFLFVLSPHLRWMSQRPLAIEARWLGLSLLLLYLSLEVRHLFHGPRLDVGPTTNAELYTYSVVWLAFGGSLLALGLRRRNVQIRYASLAIVMVTVAKAFLWDMSSLEGLYRVASFFGLGLSLIAIGYAYQRLVFTPSRPPDSGHREESLQPET